MGDPALGPGMDMGPVIDERALAKHLEYIEIGKGEGRLVVGRRGASRTRPGGYFLQPTVFADIAPDAPAGAGRDLRPGAGGHQGARISTKALAIANNTEYGLTGALYSMRRDRLEHARATSSTAATCTSTASAPARWSASSRSAAST